MRALHFSFQPPLGQKLLSTRSSQESLPFDPKKKVCQRSQSSSIFVFERTLPGLPCSTSNTATMLLLQEGIPATGIFQQVASHLSHAEKLGKRLPNQALKKQRKELNRETRRILTVLLLICFYWLQNTARNLTKLLAVIPTAANGSRN